MPLIGAFFYGPNPGPCSYHATGVGTPFTTTYAYQGTQLQGEQLQDDSIQTPQVKKTYSSDAEGRIIGSTAEDETETFEYGADYLLYTFLKGGSPKQQVRYTLNARGYPVSATITVPNQEQLTRTISYQYGNCRLLRRTTADSTGVVGEQLVYSYDSAGRIAARLDSSGSGDTYDYSCW